MFRIIYRAREVGSWLDEVLANADAPIRSDNELTAYHAAICIHWLLIHKRTSFSHDAFFVESDLAEPFECFDLALHCRALVIVSQPHVRGKVEQIQAHAVRRTKFSVREESEKFIEMFNRLWRQGYRQSNAYAVTFE